MNDLRIRRLRDYLAAVLDDEGRDRHLALQHAERELSAILSAAAEAEDMGAIVAALLDEGYTVTIERLPAEGGSVL